MYALQYEITLPAGYDMRVIDDRIAAGGPPFDRTPGLGLKAFLVRERGRDGSPVNQYAPFYLWNDTGQQARFLAGGGGFQNIVRDFGRPAARHWTGLACHAGPGRAAPAVTATRRRIPVPADLDPDGTGTGLTEFTARQAAALREFAGREGVHTAALALDPHHWELVRFVLWSSGAGTDDGEPADAPPAERYRVGHLSAPGLGALPEGPVW